MQMLFLKDASGLSKSTKELDSILIMSLLSQDRYYQNKKGQCRVKKSKTTLVLEIC